MLDPQPWAAFPERDIKLVRPSGCKTSHSDRVALEIVVARAGPCHCIDLASINVAVAQLRECARWAA